MNINIVAYAERYAGVFAELNYQWIEQYFEVESEDRLALENPFEYAIKPGGEIFFARSNDLVVGCVAMVPKRWVKTGVVEFELAKMAVRPNLQGRGVGKLLLQHCISYAKTQGASRVVLTTNDILKPALKVYHDAGFVDLPTNPDTRYARGNLAMELILLAD